MMPLWPPPASVAWRCYTGLLLLAAVACTALSKLLRLHSFWEITWTLGIWLTLTVLPLTPVAPSRRGRLWWAAYLTSIASIVTWVTCGLVELYPSDSPWDRIVWTATSALLSSSVYLTSLVILRPSPSDGPFTRHGRRAARVVGTALFAGWLTMAALANLASSFDRDKLFWMIGPPLILLTAVVLWLPAAASLDALSSVASSPTPDRTTLLGRCPRCGTDQCFTRGDTECSSCGLRISLDFDEPRCPCGYLLYGLPTNTCPECGRTVRSTSHATPLSPPAPKAKPPRQPTVQSTS